MLLAPSPSFRDLTRFVIILSLWQCVVSTGYGMPDTPIPTAPDSPRQVERVSAKTAAQAKTGLGAALQTISQTKAAAAFAAKTTTKATAKLAPPNPITHIADPADATDPFIVAKAAALGNSATAIFAFVRDQVGFDIYAGSLRGARGTLWSNAGNSLDRASLLIALLRAAGYTAQYVQGSINASLAGAILQRIFAPTALGVLGCPPPGTTLADPVHDPALAAILAQHFWVQFASGSGPMQAADPSFATSQIGTPFGTQSATFTTIPDSLHNTVSIELDSEIFNSAESLFGLSGLNTASQLSVTLATSETAGRPISIGHLVSGSTLGSVLSATTNTYTPYLSYGNTSDPTQDTIITGTEYQEMITNFPLGSTLVTGVFLKFQVNDTAGNAQTFNKTLFDRIGFAARQNGTSSSINADTSSPSISAQDITTVNILAALQDSSQVQNYSASVTSIQNQVNALTPLVANVATPPTADQSAALNSLQTLATNGTIAMTRMLATGFAVQSDALDAAVAEEMYVDAFFNSPRLILTTNHVTISGGNETIRQELDLLKDDKASIPLPGQNPLATFSYNTTRGVMESVTESNVYQGLASAYTPQNGGPVYQSGGSVADIFAAAQAQGINPVLITPSNAGLVNNMPISADAKARISVALAAGLFVVAPSSPPSINTINQFGWFQIDPNTGASQSVGEDGAHDAFAEYIATLGLSRLQSLILYEAGFFFAGFLFSFIENILLGIAVRILKSKHNSGLNLLAWYLQQLGNVGTAIQALISTNASFAIGVLEGNEAATAALKRFISKDPQVPAILTGVTPPTAGSAGSSPGVTAQLALDDFYTLGFSGAQLPLVYQAQIQNTGSATDTFTLTPQNVPAGFSITTSLPAMTIPAGAIALVDVCVVPTGSLPPPNTPESFTIKVASGSTPAISSSPTQAFNVPSVAGLTMSMSPGEVGVTPGNNATATLNLLATGNVAINAPLTVAAPPPLSISGAPASISLAAGQSQQIPLTINVPSNAALGSQNFITASVTVNPGADPITAGTAVDVVSAQAQQALMGSGSATTLGRPDIATTLSGLSGAINTALSSCTPAAQALVVAYINNLIQEMNAPFLQPIATQLQSASAAISAATCATLPAALTQLSNVLAALNSTLNSPVAFPFNLTLQPNSQTAQPAQPAVFLIGLQNNSSATNTYTLSLGSLPGGVTGALSTTSVTLAPGASIPVNGSLTNPKVTITPSTSTALQFSVSASINGVSNSAQTAFGTMTARSTFLSVQDVTPAPAFTNAGGQVDVKTHIANVVNQAKTVNVTLTVNDSTNALVRGPITQSVALSVSTLVTMVDFGNIDTTGLANGNYSLNVSVIDPTTSSVLPGGTGIGNLLIGSPVSATLTVAPTTLAPGNGTVTSTLAVSSTAGVGPGGTPYSLLGSLMTASPAEDVAINGHIAYVCDENEVSVVDITDPANPTLLGTALAGNLSNAAVLSCTIRPDPSNPSKNDLMMLVDASNTFTGNSPSFIAFDLTDPLNPSLISSTIVNKRFFRRPFYQGNNLFFSTGGVFLSGSFITGQFGDFIAMDISNLNNPIVVGGLESEVNGGTFGGAFETYGPGSIQINSTTAYMLTSTLTGSNLTNGTGQVWVVDISNPASMNATEMLNIPGTTQIGSLQFQGTHAVALGNTAGWISPLPSNGSSAQGGNVVVAVLDITDPRNPQIVSNVATQYVFGIGGGQTVLGTNLFLFGGIADSMGNQVVMTVDTTDPLNPVIKTFPVPGNFDNLLPVGNLLYAATSDHGLQIYSIPGTSGAIQYHATVRVPNTGKVIYNPSSFSVHPAITPGASFDTLSWTNPGVNTITWTSAVTGISPGDVLPVDLGGTVNFTVPLGSGTITLPQVDINSGQILGLNPGTQTSAPGAMVNYTLIVNNPTNAPITYNLAVTGINPAWVGLQSTVTVAPNASVNVPLTLHSAIADIANTYNFTVTATSGPSSGTVQGALILTGQGTIGAPGPTTALGVAAALTPAQQTGGQATTATYAVQITNAGNVADTYTLSASTPAGVTATFDQASLQIQPGLSNFKQTLVHLTAAQGLAGAKNFTVTATSQTNTGVQGVANGTLNLISQGVAVALSVATVAPGGALQFTITNKGNATDTFNLSLGGPAALISTLALSKVTLGQNQSTSVLISVGSAQGAVTGNLALLAIATSGANSAISAAAQASVVVPAIKGVSAAFAPQRTGLNAPGPATLLLQIQNTGSVDDGYVAQIVSTSGPITASLVDINGHLVQTTSLFDLPGASQGQFAVKAVLTGSGGDGTVTVKITSQTDSSITATAVGALGLGTSVPVAVPGKNRNVKGGVYTSLDGGQSYDPFAARLTYAWTLQSKPNGSTATLSGATTPQPFFLPDVNGAYTLQLIVNNGSTSSAPQTVTANASSAAIPPNANAGRNANALRGSPVILNGSASNDPSGANLALTYNWTVQSAPSGSTLLNTQIGGNSATPSFIPDADGAFVIALRVSDANGSSNDTVTITSSDSNVTPNANAGPNRRILINTAITVDGSASSDPDKGPQSLTDEWRFVSSTLSDSALQNANGAMTAFVPVAPGFYVLRLDTSDGSAVSFSETTVMAAKFCDANADGQINQADFDLMTALIGTATIAGDPLDVNGDGVITPADIAQCKGAPAVNTQPNLYVTPAFLVFQYTKGETLPTAQTLQITADQNTAFSIPNVYSWLKLGQVSPSTPSAVSVSIDPSGLAAGPYLAQLFPIAQGFNSPPPVRIELTVFDAPVFVIVPNAVTFNYVIGGPQPAPQTVAVGTTGKVSNFTATVSGGSWLSVNPNAGITPKPVVFTANPASNMAPGVYNALATFTSPEAASTQVMVTLNVIPAPPVIDTTRLVNAASNLVGPVAPGEVLFLNGNGFATPGTNIQWMPGTAVPFEMGDTQVFFDGIPAPMLLLESNVIEAIVPYEVALKLSTQQPTIVKVVYANVPSNSVAIPVIATNPGIFTADGTGLGQILATNADGTSNSVNHPAARGSTVTFLVTGEGQTVPPGVDGAITSNPAPQPKEQQIQVTIGGKLAQATVAEQIGKPAGFLQVTVMIPGDAPVGVPDEVLIQVGGGLSQRGAVMYVN